jgi:hypothetical protein
MPFFLVIQMIEINFTVGEVSINKSNKLAIRRVKPLVINNPSMG